MKVVLVRKLAEEFMNGVDVRGRRVGDMLDVPESDAEMLVAEHWALPDRRHPHGVTPAVERRRGTDGVTLEAYLDKVRRTS